MIYEFKCTNEKCEHTWELERKLKDPPILICPECEEETAERVISKTSFVLKGGGWYKEGYSSSK